MVSGVILLLTGGQDAGQAKHWKQHTDCPAYEKGRGFRQMKTLYFLAELMLDVFTHLEGYLGKHLCLTLPSRPSTKWNQIT
jgi:hypothetical protein